MSIIDNTPEKGYQDNDTVRAVLSYPEVKVKAWVDLMQSWYTRCLPDTAPDSYLDYVAYLLGYTAQYWNPKWSNIQKRNILKLGYKFWGIRGTKDAILKWIAALNLNISVWTGTTSSLPSKLKFNLGSRKTKVVFRLPLQYLRGSTEWNEALRIQQNLVPIAVPSKVGYETFRLGFSKLGEPVFRQRIYHEDVLLSTNDVVSTDGQDVVTT